MVTETSKRIVIGMLAAVGVVAILMVGWHLYRDHENLDNIIKLVVQQQQQAQQQQQRAQPRPAPQPSAPAAAPASTPESTTPGR